MSKSKALIINLATFLFPPLLLAVLTMSGAFNFARSEAASWPVVVVCIGLILAVWAVNILSYKNHRNDAVISLNSDERYKNFVTQTAWSIVFMSVTILVLVVLIVFATVVDKGAVVKNIFAAITDDRITIKAGKLYALAITTVVLQIAVWFVMACVVTCDRTVSLGMFRKKK